MPNNRFVFKQFTIHQDRCAMKVGTDAVLLGAWITIEAGVKNILDVGTGTGIIALMAAQKSNDANIHAIDIDKDACVQAQENAERSNWKDRIRIYNLPFQEYAENNSAIKHELIVSNPPYFIDSSKASVESRSHARHADLLPFDALISGVKKIIHPEGKFCLILPNKEGELFRDMAEADRLFLTKLTRIRTRADKPSEKRLLMQFEPKRKSFSENAISIEMDETRGKYTPEYQELTKDFYLNF